MARVLFLPKPFIDITEDEHHKLSGSFLDILSFMHLSFCLLNLPYRHLQVGWSNEVALFAIVADCKRFS